MFLALKTSPKYPVVSNLIFPFSLWNVHWKMGYGIPNIQTHSFSWYMALNLVFCPADITTCSHLLMVKGPCLMVNSPFSRREMSKKLLSPPVKTSKSHTVLFKFIMNVLRFWTIHHSQPKSLIYIYMIFINRSFV